MEELPKDVEKYGDALVKAWEQYLKIIDLLIALCGATALILVSLLREFGAAKIHSSLGSATITVFGATLLLITLWRLAAQHFFEYETIGGSETSKRYFEHHKIEQPFTRAFRPQYRLRAFYRFVYPLVAYGSGLMLATTWVLLISLTVA